ncbi:diphthamide biosynthesis protein 2-like [Tropilaelaps mercedesae]|uniref:2-(3-amino-3-carboxypropyl)histidine synthase subunit 2 n=1 Tax=Tropilaelaps mercedesae TaxID=418985 RepID=A0A1V9X7G0_9ACAR|nr:diphthamide biosynthesis protein 2-like [Tropilaelaps mercedesae]
MRRHFLVEKAKDASIIGILVGTLGVRNYLQAIGHLRDLIRKAGRKSYTLAVGKLNVAKLANFQEIDIYVYVACPENSFFDSKEFYRPVVTPYELEVALNPNRKWGTGFFTNFNDILPGGPAYVAVPEDMENTLNYDISLISGKLRTFGNESELGGEAGVIDNEALVKREAGTVLVARTVGAGEMLVQRSWQGLDPGSGGHTSPSKLKSGRSGIAMRYTNEEE